MIKHQAVVMAEGVKKIIEKPETFFEHFKKGKYFKPMKDKKMLKEVELKLKKKGIFPL